MEIYREAIEVFEVCSNIALGTEKEKSFFYRKFFLWREKGQVAGRCSQKCTGKGDVSR